MTLKPRCECSTCACGNAPGRSGYCLNCEVTDSGEGSHTQHTPGPIDWSTVKASRAIAATWSTNPRDLEADAAYDEIVRRWEAYDTMLEALRVIASGDISVRSGVTDRQHIDGMRRTARSAAIAAAKRPSATRS